MYTPLKSNIRYQKWWAFPKCISFQTWLFLDIHVRFQGGYASHLSPLLQLDSAWGAVRSNPKRRGHFCWETWRAQLTMQVTGESPKQKSGASAWLGFFGGMNYYPCSIGIIIGWWFQTFFYFNPHLGEVIKNLTNSFQMGWNHQLDNDYKDPY